MYNNGKVTDNHQAGTGMSKADADSTYGSKLLKLFRILLADRNRHYLSDLKKTLNCSSHVDYYVRRSQILG